MTHLCFFFSLVFENFRTYIPFAKINSRFYFLSAEKNLLCLSNAEDTKREVENINYTGSLSRYCRLPNSGSSTAPKLALCWYEVVQYLLTARGVFSTKLDKSM